MVYTIDSYRPIGGEVVVTQLAFKGYITCTLASNGLQLTLQQLVLDFYFPFTPTHGLTELATALLLVQWHPLLE